MLSIRGILKLLISLFCLSFSIASNAKGVEDVIIKRASLNAHRYFSQESLNATGIEAPQTYDRTTSNSSPEFSEVTGNSKQDLWDVESLITLNEVVDLHEHLLEKMKQFRAEHPKMDDATFEEKYGKGGRMIFEDPATGSAELNMIDGQYIVRVKHKKTELAFIFAEKEADFNSAHWKQYIARQHLQAGTSRHDGETGRDVVLFKKISWSLKDEDSEELYDSARYTYLDRPKKHTSLRWWQEYWNAIKKPATKDTAVFGAFCGFMQMGSSFVGEHMKCMVNYTGPHLSNAIHSLNHILTQSPFVPMKGPALLEVYSHFNSSTGLLALGWGAAIGTFVSLYKNWTSNIGTRTTKTLKSTSNGILFAELLKHLNHQPLMNASTQESILGNTLANNLAKTTWNEFTRIPEEVGLTRSTPFVLNFFNFKYIFKDVKLSSAQNQLIYLIPFTIRLLDLMDFRIMGFPVGRFLLWASIPAVEVSLVYYAKSIVEKSHNHPKAVEIYSRLNRSLEQKKLVLRDIRNGLLDIMNRMAMGYWPSWKDAEASEPFQVVSRLMAKGLASLREDTQTVDRLSKELSELYPEVFTYYHQEMASSDSSSNKQNAPANARRLKFTIPSQDRPAFSNFPFSQCEAALAQ